jgi:glycosyltransferase involved in cell wall biosynthesis
MTSGKKLSIVAPMYNEELCIDEFIKETLRAIVPMGIDYEIVLVDDGSKDKTYAVAKKISESNLKIKTIRFSRNFGHQMALLAGLKFASGDVIIMMDSDLQHPPELIPELMRKHLEGFDVVHTVRVSTEKETLTKKLTSKAFYTLINRLSYTPIIPGAADFRLVTKKVNDVFCSLSEYDRFNRGLFSWVGFHSTTVDYMAKERFAGKSNYTFRKMLSLALSSITSFSGKPLRVSFYMGLMTLGIVFLYLIYFCFDYFANGTVRGWSSLFFSITMLGSVQLISIGVLGEYIYRIYNEVKQRPHYVVDEKNNL